MSHREAFCSLSGLSIIDIENFLRVYAGRIIYYKRGFDPDHGITAADGIDQNHIGFLVCKWMNEPHPLWFQPIFRQTADDLDQPEWPVYHQKMSAGF